MLMPVIQRGARPRPASTSRDIGFTCSGSHRLPGRRRPSASCRPSTASGPWPPIQESHVEMDGAWALYEAWVKLQLGEIDTALVYCYGKSSPGRPPRGADPPARPVLASAPLWPDAISLAALQARALLDAGKATEADLAEVAARSRQGRARQPQRPAGVGPARRATCSPRSRSSTRCASTTARRSPTAPPRWSSPPATVARELLRAPGVDPRHRPPHRADGPRRARPHRLGRRPALAGEKAGVGDGAGRRGRAPRPVHPPGADPARGARPRRRRERQPVGRRAGRQPDDGRRPHPHRRGGRAHHRRRRPTAASPTPPSGPCLQQNLVCVLEGEG